MPEKITVRSLRELNTLVAKHCQRQPGFLTPNYATDLNAALPIAIAGGWTIKLFEDRGAAVYPTSAQPWEIEVDGVYAATLPLAICLAGLKAAGLDIDLHV